jgi:alanine dehydrogenase
LVKPDLSVYTLDFEKMSVTFPDGKKAIRFKDWDKKYQQSGATTVSAREAWNTQLVVKVKEPLRSEYHYLQGQILCCHIACYGTHRS